MDIRNNELLFIKSWSMMRFMFTIVSLTSGFSMILDKELSGIGTK